MLFCAAENCEKPVHCKGFCRPHYQRLTAHGRLNKLKDNRTKHPLYMTWNANRQRGGFVKEWNDDFWNDKSGDTRLVRLKLNEPFGPNNFKLELLFKPLENETDIDRRKRQRKQKSLNDPNMYRSLNYKYNFGLSLEEYEIKLKVQNYVCAICEQPETVTYKDTGVVKNLAVDHCHITNKIRDLLCSKCNLFVGKLEDNIAILNKFTNYIEKHK